MTIIHLPTVLIALATGYAMLVLDLFLARRSLMVERPELRTWAYGSLLLLLGFLAIPLRRWILLGPAILLSNGLMAMGLTVYGQALHQFICQRNLPRVTRIFFGCGLLLMAWTALYTKALRLLCGSGQLLVRVAAGSQSPCPVAKCLEA